MFDDLAKQIIDDYRSDPRNKVFVSELALLAATQEETGQKISAEALKVIVEAWQNGDLSDDQEQIYDGATYACSFIANRCFSDDPDDEDAEVDYEITWLVDSSGSTIAELRPN